MIRYGIYHMFGSGLFYKPNPLFLFCFVVVELLRSQMRIPYLFQVVFSCFYGSANPSRSSSLSSQFLLTGVLLFKWIRSFSTSARSTLSILNGVCFIRPKLSFFFPPSHPFSSDSDFLIKYHFIDGKSLHS